MGVRERKQRQKASLRQEILDAALAIILSDGLAGFSMRRVAEKIEYTPTTIYLYFKDKSDILFHLCEDVYGQVADILDGIRSADKMPLERVRSGMKAYMEFGLSNPDRYRIAFMTNVSPGMDPASFLKRGGKALFAYDLLRCLADDAIAYLRLPADLGDSIAQALWASSHGTVALLIEHPGFPWVEREKLVETTIEIALGGLRALAPGGIAPTKRRNGRRRAAKEGVQ